MVKDTPENRARLMKSFASNIEKYHEAIVEFLGSAAFIISFLFIGFTFFATFHETWDSKNLFVLFRFFVCLFAAILSVFGAAFKAVLTTLVLAVLGYVVCAGITLCECWDDITTEQPEPKPTLRREASPRREKPPSDPNADIARQLPDIRHKLAGIAKETEAITSRLEVPWPSEMKALAALVNKQSFSLCSTASKLSQLRKFGSSCYVALTKLRAAEQRYECVSDLSKRVFNEVTTLQKSEHERIHLEAYRTTISEIQETVALFEASSGYLTARQWSVHEDLTDAVTETLLECSPSTILGLTFSPSITMHDVKKAHRQAAKRFHSDVSGSNDDSVMARMNDAYEKLTRYLSQHQKAA